ncbi:hypothetical protein [Sporosarcina psychrophila]|uniref:Phage-associated protein n=1 Tax=Sporosarcina psychrophila TaxID=1476 RepID=A0ABV2K9Q2_SPOPS
MGMREFADHVVSVSNEFADGVTNLQLQKVMYFALGNYISARGIDDVVIDIYDEAFEAWPYGPVVRSEYFRNRSFGRYNIRRAGQPFAMYDNLNDFILHALEEDINDLVEESHLHNTWLINKEAILRHELVEYNLEDIVDDFSD